MAPKNGRAGDTHILYLHGGAYVQSFLIFHWWFIAMLVKKLNCTVTAPDYPLAPKHTYKESFDMLRELYARLLTTTDSGNIIFMGDSSGGGFALAMAQQLRSIQSAQPAQIILLSPWLDITLSNPLIEKVDAIDLFLGIEALREVGKLYAGDTSADHYLLSPINGPLKGLGKISVFIGTRDILLADARKLASLAASRGIAINYHEYIGMIHVWMFLNFPESRQARRQIVDLIRNATS